MIKALLNDEGKKVWGYAFPEGEIPVKNLVSQTAMLEGLGEEKVFLVNWEALTMKQKSLVLDHFKKRFGNSEVEVEAEIRKKGLPLRAKYVSCTSIPAYLLS